MKMGFVIQQLTKNFEGHSRKSTNKNKKSNARYGAKKGLKIQEA